MTRNIQTIGTAAAITLLSQLTGCWYAQQPPKKPRPEPVEGSAVEIGEGYVLVAKNSWLVAVDVRTGKHDILVQPYRDNTTGISHYVIKAVGNNVILSRLDQNQNDLDILTLSRKGRVLYDSQTPTTREEIIGVTDTGAIVYTTSPERRVLRLDPVTKEISDLFADDPNIPATREAIHNKNIVVTHEGNMHGVYKLNGDATSEEIVVIDDLTEPFNGFDLTTKEVVSYKGLIDPNVTELVFYRRSTNRRWIFEVPDSTLEYSAVSAVETPNSDTISAIVRETNGTTNRLLDPNFLRSAITSTYRTINTDQFAGWTPRAFENTNDEKTILDAGRTLVGILGEKANSPVPEILFYDRTTRTVSDLITPLLPSGMNSIGIEHSEYKGNALIQAEARYNQQPNVNKVVTYDGTLLDPFDGYEESKIKAVSEDGRYAIVKAARHQTTAREEELYVIDIEHLPQSPDNLRDARIVAETGKNIEHVVFSADETKIAYSVYDAINQAGEIHIHDRTTGEHERVYRSEERLSITQWRGKYMLVDTTVGKNGILLNLEKRSNQGDAKSVIISEN